MERMAVHVVRILGRFLDAMPDMIVYNALLLFSSISAGIILMADPRILEFISAFDSIFIIFIICAFTFLIFTVCCSFYMYIKFIKYSKKTILNAGLFILIVSAVAYVLKRLDECGLVGYSLSESFEGISSVLMILWLALCMFLILILFHRIGEHKINTRFNDALKRLEKIQNNEIKNYKDMYEIHNASDEYSNGIKEVKNLLIRGIDLDGFFDLNTELSLNEILDWLTFSMQYYLFYGGPEQVESAKNHMERMVGNFDDKYRINTNQFMRETSRMYYEINRYFKENNIDIVRSTKFTDRAMSYLQPVLLAIVLLVISMITKYFIIN